MGGGADRGGGWDMGSRTMVCRAFSEIEICDASGKPILYRYRVRKVRQCGTVTCERNSANARKTTAISPIAVSDSFYLRMCARPPLSLQVVCGTAENTLGLIAIRESADG